MRLSPFFVTMVAITAPLSGSLSAKAQTPNDSEQPAEIFTSTIDQDQNSVSLFLASELEKPQEVIVPTSTAVPETNQEQEGYTVPEIGVKSRSIANQENEEIAVFPTESVKEAKSKVVIPHLQIANTGKNPTSATKITTVTDQAINQPANIVISKAAALKTTPQSISKNTIATLTAQNIPVIPVIPQQAPQQAPQEAPNQQNVTPPGTEQPASPTIPDIQPNQTPPEAEPRVLVSEVLVISELGQPLPPELENEVYRVVRTQPGRTTTRSQLQEDINAVFATGFFSNVQALPQDTPLGVRVSFVVQPNPVLTKVQIQANPGTNVPSVLPANTVDEIFRDQYGRILNLRELQESIQQLTKLYQDKGYVLAQVVGAPQVNEQGVVTLQVAEGVVEDIRVRYRTKDGQETDEQGQPIGGRTQPYIVTREIELQPGQVFNRNIVQRDLQRVFGLGLFEDVNISLDPGTDPSTVDVVVNVVERNTGSVAAGAGISSASGLFGTISYQEQNLNGRNQRLGAELQVGQRELLFDVRFTDPWIAGDPYRTSYTINGFRRRSISLIFDGPDENIETFNPDNPDADGDRPRVLRLGGGVTFNRPLSTNPFERAEWTASAGLQYQRVSVRDRDGDLRRLGRLEDTNELLELSQSGRGEDDLLLLQLGAVRDRRNNALTPTSGSFFRVGVDQSVPVGLGSIFLTRLRSSYSQYIPVNFTNFAQGAETLAFNVQGGTVLGDLPPYEAFTLGGSNSVRGYGDGELGSSRSFLQASVEYRFPVFSVVSGAVFFDLGTDFGTATRAAELLDKNGTGYGYGLGVRVQSPLGPIRIDYGFSDEGESRINFGIGERF